MEKGTFLAPLKNGPVLGSKNLPTLSTSHLDSSRGSILKQVVSASQTEMERWPGPILGNPTMVCESNYHHYHHEEKKKKNIY